MIPFRNEEGRILGLLTSLKFQVQNSSTKVQVIFVDDHSSDEGFKQVQEAVGGLEGFTVLKSNGIGKKAAIRTGVSYAEYDRIVTLDADIEIPDNWLSLLVKLDVSMSLYILPVSLNDNSFSWFENQEWNFLQSLTYLSARKGRALMCNGAHLEFSKKLFDENLPNEHSVSSGDDIFLLEAVKKKGDVGVCFHRDIVISTPGSSSWGDYFSRRIRWNGKNMKIKDSDIKLFGGVFSLVQVCSLALLCLGSFYLFFLKVTIEFLVFYKAQRLLGRQMKVLEAISFLALLPLYTVSIFIATIIYQPEWKGRKVKR